MYLKSEQSFIWSGTKITIQIARNVIFLIETIIHGELANLTSNLATRIVCEAKKI